MALRLAANEETEILMMVGYGNRVPTHQTGSKQKAEKRKEKQFK